MSRRGTKPASLLAAMRRELPYALPSVPGQPGLRIMAGRAYKPVGHEDHRTFARYEDHPECWVPISDDQLAEIVHRAGGHHLFDDGCAPWLAKRHAEAYVARLAALRQIVATQ
jgi:hypothetical protein